MNPMLAQKVIQVIAARADALGFEALSDPERNALHPWWARGIIGNGGFKYFFEGRSDFVRYDLAVVGRRFRGLGFHAAANACEEVVSALFGGVQPTDPASWKAVAGRAEWGQFEQQEDAIYGVAWDPLLLAIGEYIDRTPDAFADAIAALAPNDASLKS